MAEAIRARLHVLSPVHIGCGDEYEPTSFVIHPDQKRLISFDMFRFFDGLDDDARKTMTRIAGKGTLASIIELYRFIFSQRSNITGWDVGISDSVITRYLKVKELPLDERRLQQELNNFHIPRTAYNALDNRPYIPGSSLKGSIRTGYLSLLARAGGTRHGIETILSGGQPPNPVTGQTNARKLEEQLLGGKFDTDTFRMVKVSDLSPAENVRTRILYGINRKKSEVGAGRGVPQILEVILPGSIFEGVISIEPPLNGSGIRMPVEKEKLFSLVQKHYAKVYNDELKTARAIHYTPPRPNDVKKLVEGRGNSPHLVRIGFHSGAESVTIEGNRTITIRGPGRSRTERDRATTIWLASENENPQNNRAMMPFGWAMLEIEAGRAGQV